MIHDCAIIGGGIVGLASAMVLAREHGRRVIVLEAEPSLAVHQSGHNSGVIHSGLYYRPGSLKAQLCVRGRRELLEFCCRHGIAHDVCGKLVIATNPRQLPALDELERRGTANGLDRLRRLSADALREYEPHARGVAGLWVPQTGIVDFPGVCRAYAHLIEARGGEVRTSARVLRIERRGDALVLATASGDVPCGQLVNCAGLQSDRVARLGGVDPVVRIVPFRGEYYQLADQRTSLVRNLIYPVPDARFPFLGVHFTRMIGGGVEAGPNAVLALARHGYRWTDISPVDLMGTLTFGGFWRMAGRYWRAGMGEVHRSLSRSAFVRALRELVPEVRDRDLRRGGAGVRAQALDPRGALVDDFRIVRAERMIHVLNAPSPAATASLAIGRVIAAMAADASIEHPSAIAATSAGD